MSKLTHIDNSGRAQMVDVSDKAVTQRTATAEGKVIMSQEAFDLSGPNKKGDPVAIAELAGIMGAKKTSELIPLCHPLPLTKVTTQIAPLADGIGYSVTATAKTDGKTGVEMEALSAVSIACLTLYDMLKAVDKAIEITDIRLLAKTGGKSGDFKR
ncbi:MAG: cyclic pyranopterin monophosphate synthase MoaC [Maricaulaceae bacterium]